MLLEIIVYKIFLVFWVYISLTVVLLIGISYLAFTQTDEIQNFKGKFNCWKLTGKFIKKLCKLGACYFPVFTHLFDQASDLSVLIVFYKLWQQQTNLGDNQICDRFDMDVIFFSTLQ